MSIYHTTCICFAQEKEGGIERMREGMRGKKEEAHCNEQTRKHLKVEY